MSTQSSAGRIPLAFDTISLVFWPGIFGILPAGIWFGALLSPLALLHLDPPQHGVLAMALAVVSIGGSMFVVLLGPALTAGLVQRARQPLPARLEWAHDAITEWNGDWARTTIPWARLDVGWQRLGLRSGSTSALQLRDGESGALIHVWAFDPPGGGPVRRRIYASVADVRTLVEAIQSHQPEFAAACEAAAEKNELDCTVGAPDWSLAADRYRPRWMVNLGRLGYVGACIAPLLAIAPPSPTGLAPAMIAGFIVAAISTALLVLRAWPSIREWRELERVPEPSLKVQAAAGRAKRRAVLAEVILRVGFAAMVPYSTLAATLFSLAHP